MSYIYTLHILYNNLYTLCFIHIRYFSFHTRPVICTIIGKEIGTQCVVITIKPTRGRKKRVWLSLEKCPSILFNYIILYCSIVFRIYFFNTNI